MRFFLAAKRTFCVITLYALEIKALFFKARFAANLDDYKCVACCKRVYSCGETIKKHEVSFFCPILRYCRSDCESETVQHLRIRRSAKWWCVAFFGDPSYMFCSGAQTYGSEEVDSSTLVLEARSSSMLLNWWYFM